MALRICQCGCGNPVDRKGYKYIKGHFDIGELNRGKKFTKSHREKISIARLGQSMAEETKRKLSEFWKGKPKPPFTDEHRKKLSVAKIGVMIGEKHPRWKGGTSPYPRNWRLVKKEIRKRDSSLCVLCGTGNYGYFVFPDIHHIDDNKQNCEDKNLACLCRKCHMVCQHDIENSSVKLHAILSERYGYTYP